MLGEMGFGVMRYDGDSSQKKRARALNYFRDQPVRRAKFLLMTPQVGTNVGTRPSMHEAHLPPAHGLRDVCARTQFA